MKMQKNGFSDAEGVKVFSDNHNKHEITLRTWGKPHKEKGAEFKARLTRYELAKVCDFITKNFTDNGRK